MPWPMSMPSSNSTTPHFRLLDLPTEIRESILEYALVSDKPIVAFRLDSYQSESYNEAKQPPLTRVSRQIRRECLPAFYEVNDFILHTEEPRLHHTGKWLQWNEGVLPNLLNLSLWIRYVTLTNDRHSTSGAICIHMTRSKRDAVWRASHRWKWQTVTRRPSAIEGDAKFIIAQLQKLLEDESMDLNTASGFMALLRELRLLYIKEKMS